MSIYSTGNEDLGPLIVSPKTAWKMLQCSNSYGYELLARGELESIKNGRSRRITVESIHRLINRRLDASKAEVM